METHEENWTYQQDNAPIHNAKLVNDVFNTQNISILAGVALSPDSHPTKSLWSILSNKVYENGQQDDPLSH